MDVRHRFWMEDRTGAVWAVELRNHVVTACYGPLPLDEIDDDLLGTFDYATGGVAWIRANEEHFTPYTPLVPDIPAT